MIMKWHELGGRLKTLILILIAPELENTSDFPQRNTVMCTNVLLTVPKYTGIK